MSKFFIGASVMIAVFLFAALATTSTVESIAADCQKAGAFHAGAKVYECKLKP